MDQQTGTAVGGDVGSDIAQAIAQAVGAAVTTSMSEITAKLNSISESVKKSSQNDDRGFETDVTGAYDVYENMRRNDAHRDRVQALAEKALADALEIGKAVALRSIDHFGSLPPVGAKVSGC